jgi:hypothetical protein
MMCSSNPVARDCKTLHVYLSGYVHLTRVCISGLQGASRSIICVRHMSLDRFRSKMAHAGWMTGFGGELQEPES